jgi:uncharacterized protein YbjT (DUF2867 family)
LACSGVPKWSGGSSVAESNVKPLRVLVTGASGFIGGRLIQALAPDHEVIALRRAAPSDSDRGGPIEWRSCDLYSLVQTEAAVRGADVAVYLVHSMLPTARLTQASFEDTDVLLADNFARACERNGIQRIVYLGGLVPPEGDLSPHLLSRLEVEKVLASRGASVVSLRAGLILGGEGSSFQILMTLVKRLPVMICPAWTRSLTQPIAVEDTLRLLRYAIEHSELPAGSYDIGGRERLSYQQLMAVTAEALGVRRRFYSVPFFSPGLSLLWVRLITGASRNLISPLVQSLKHEMTVRNEALLKLAGPSEKPLRESLRQALAGARPLLRQATQLRLGFLRARTEVRSIQRLPLPTGWDAKRIALGYFNWLPRFLAPLVQVRERGEGLWSFRLLGLPLDLLRLKDAGPRSFPDRSLFWIVGGLLVAKDSPATARLEFRLVRGESFFLAAIHEFKPRLPWLVYRWTQAKIHLWVMRAFGRHLARQTGTGPSKLLSTPP